VAVMKGRAHAAKQADEQCFLTAWYGEMLARQKKLKPASEYLGPADNAPVQAEVVLDAMLTMQAHGIPMDVRKLN
jgi:hypothetical protein